MKDPEVTDSTIIDFSIEMPVIEGGLTRAEIDQIVAKPMDTKPTKKYLIALSVSVSFLLFGAYCLAIQLLLRYRYVG